MGGDGPPRRTARSSRSGRTGPAGRPPALFFAVTLLMLLVAAALLYTGGDFVPCLKAASCEPAENVAGFVGGSLIGVVSFGAYMAKDNRQRATKRYRDWLVSPRGLIPWIAALAWVLGILHMLGVALHLTRLL